MNTKQLIKKLAYAVPGFQFIRERRIYSHLHASKIARAGSKLTEQEALKTIIPYDSISGKALVKWMSRIEYPRQEGNLYYYLDERFYLGNSGHIVGNIPVDYSLPIDNSLERLGQADESAKTVFMTVVEKIIKANPDAPFAKSLESFKTESCKGFEEALQRILFINMLLWQTGHYLSGLGRLDRVLFPYYEKDIANKVLTPPKAKELIKEFLVCLHRHYGFKSNTLLGDTGQLIILGGLQEDGSYYWNDLTVAFLEAVAELKLPDPKTLIRFSEKTPRELTKVCLEALASGNGSPLFANDDRIIDCLIAAGYDREDAFNYGVSACWEPLIIGKSTDRNNASSFVLPNVVNAIVERAIASSASISSIGELISFGEKEIKDALQQALDQCDAIRYMKDPIQSSCMHGCFETGVDLADGGAKYNYPGILCPGFSNGVNALIAIDQLVFQRKELSLADFNSIRRGNFAKKDELVSEIGLFPAYGEDDPYVIDLTNRVIDIMASFCKEKRNRFGCKAKFGLSSPNYIEESKDAPASFDGRKAGAPFNVHISTTKPTAYTELFNFASGLHYSGESVDGNVIDFFISPSFLKANQEKFSDFIYRSTKDGFFEFQANVLSYQTLLDAKKNPSAYPNLIVRVWGFSAYFVDLPENYQNVLIERARISENPIG